MSKSNILKYTQSEDLPVLIKSGAIFRETEGVPETDIIQEQAVLEKVRNEIDALRSSAAKIVADAENEAARILEQSRQEAQHLKQQAQKDGHKIGYQEGLENGRNIGLAQVKDSIDEAVSKAEGILTIAQSQAKKMIFEADDEIIEIVKEALQKALCREVLSNPEYITEVVKEALIKVRDHEQIVIRVNPWNFDILMESRHELQKILGREHDLNITADKTIAIGGCVIDTSNGSVDANLDTKLELLVKVLEEIREIEKSKKFV